MKFFSRSSRATGPKMRVPRGLRCVSMITAAFSSKAIERAVVAAVGLLRPDDDRPHDLALLDRALRASPSSRCRRSRRPPARSGGASRRARGCTGAHGRPCCPPPGVATPAGSLGGLEDLGEAPALRLARADASRRCGRRRRPWPVLLVVRVEPRRAADDLLVARVRLHVSTRTTIVLSIARGDDDAAALLAPAALVLGLRQPRDRLALRRAARASASALAALGARHALLFGFGSETAGAAASAGASSRGSPASAAGSSGGAPRQALVLGRRLGLGRGLRGSGSSARGLSARRLGGLSAARARPPEPRLGLGSPAGLLGSGLLGVGLLGRSLGLGRRLLVLRLLGLFVVSFSVFVSHLALSSVALVLDGQDARDLALGMAQARAVLEHAGRRLEAQVEQLLARLGQLASSSSSVRSRSSLALKEIGLPASRTSS